MDTETFNKCHFEAKHVLLEKVVCFNRTQNYAFIILSPVKHIVLAWRKTKLNHMLKVEEFRKTTLSIKSVPCFSSLGGGGKQAGIPVRRG